MVEVTVTRRLRDRHEGEIGSYETRVEAEMDALHKGWDMYLHTLDQYLTHFPGRFALVMFAPPPGPEPMWQVLRRGLGISGEVVQGDRVRLTPAGLPPIEGIADCVAPGFLGVRTGDGLYRFIRGAHNTVMVGHHIFRDDADPKDSEDAWEAWLTDLFA